MDNSTKLRQLLSDTIKSENVYFNPGKGVNLRYPCIVFNEAKGHALRSDNTIYRYVRKYEFKYISKTPDEAMVDILMKLLNCSFDRPYVSDQLYHYCFTIYY